MDEEDDELPYGVAPPGKVLSSAASRTGSTIVRLQEAYERWMSSRKGRTHKISEGYKAGKVWETMATNVIEAGAYPEDWIRAQFEMLPEKAPYASHMVGAKALERYMQLRKRHEADNPQPSSGGGDLMSHLTEQDLDKRISELRGFLRQQTGKDNADSLDVMKRIDYCAMGVDALAILLESESALDMYLSIFAVHAADDLRRDPDLMSLCTKRYPRKVAKILNYADKHRNDS